MLKLHNGSIQFLGKTVEIPFVKKLLSEYYNFKVIDESKDFFECKLIMIRRGLFYPYLGPHTRLRIEICRDLNNCQLKYSFFWPEYVWAVIISLVCLCVNYQDLLLGIWLSVLALVFIGTIIFFNTMAVARCIKGLFQELKNQL